MELVFIVPKHSTSFVYFRTNHKHMDAFYVVQTIKYHSRKIFAVEATLCNKPESNKLYISAKSALSTNFAPVATDILMKVATN
jgi:hypothetical protein